MAVNGGKLCGAETSFGGSPSCLKRDESVPRPPFTSDIMKDRIKRCETPVCLYPFFSEQFLLLKGKWQELFFKANSRVPVMGGDVSNVPVF